MSEVEKTAAWLNQAEGIWLDGFASIWYDGTKLQKILDKLDSFGMRRRAKEWPDQIWSF